MLYRLCRVREISPGTHTFFHTYTCPVYCWRSVQFLDFGLFGSLIHASQPVRDSCSSGQCFASGFLQTHTSRWCPCLWLHPSHCRADQGLSPLRTCARRAHQKAAPCGSTGRLFGFRLSGISRKGSERCFRRSCWKRHTSNHRSEHRSAPGRLQLRSEHRCSSSPSSEETG